MVIKLMLRAANSIIKNLVLGVHRKCLLWWCCCLNNSDIKKNFQEYEQSVFWWCYHINYEKVIMFMKKLTVILMALIT
jgi:hypothetical protein